MGQYKVNSARIQINSIDLKTEKRSLQPFENKFCYPNIVVPLDHLGE